MRWVLHIALYVLFTACTANQEGQVEKGATKIFYLNSYHPGYKPSDDIRDGFDRVINADSEVITFYLDSKRLDETEVMQRADSAIRLIRSFAPDVIVTSDDNAIKYVIEPHFKNGPFPVVFTGVNWQCDQYGLPTDYVTGILEILPVRTTVDTLKNYFPDIMDMAVLSENSTSEQKNKEIFSSLFADQDLRIHYRLVNEFDAWKSAFDSLNNSVDLVFLPTNGSIRNWDDAEAEAWVKSQIEVPVATCDDFMMQYAVFGLTKRPDEMGEWAAHRVMEILSGKDVSSIAVTTNKTYEAWINPVLSEEIGFSPGDSLSARLRQFQTENSESP